MNDRAVHSQNQSRNVPRRLRVLHILSADLWAGAEVATFHLLSALAERPGLEVRAILLNPGTVADRLQSAGIQHHVYAEAEHGLLSLVRYVRAHAEDADVVHAHRYKENLLAALSGRPWVATQHGRPEPFAERTLRSRLRQASERPVLRSASKLIAVSSEVAQFLERRVPRDRIETVWNGIADPVPSVPTPKWSDRPQLVGCLGRLFPVKAYELAIEAVARCPGLTLEIVGEGPERPALECAIARAGAEKRIRLVGHDPNPLHRVASWRALLVCSLHEGSPISVIEALALSTPVMFGDLPGVNEMLCGQGGWPVRSREPDVWAKELQAKLADSSGGEAASQAARQRFEGAFSSSALACRVEAIYRSVVPISSHVGHHGT